MWTAFVRHEVALDVHQRLLPSALRRLSRREYLLAVIDAETGVEVCIAEMIRRVMRSRGSTDEQIDAAFEDYLIRLQQEIVYLDRLAAIIDANRLRFEGSEVHRRWTNRLADLRHDIAHRGLRDMLE